MSMDEFLNALRNYQWTPMNVLKLAAIGIAALVVVSFALKMITATVGPVAQSLGIRSNMVAPMMGGGVAYDMAMSEEAAYYGKGGGDYDDGMQAELSYRNAANSIGIMPPIAPIPGSPTGDTAEAFEVSEYNVTVETGDHEEDCGVVLDLKQRSYVIFESTNEHDNGCNFSFKVERDQADDVLAVIKDLDPKDLSENTYTIKRQVDDFTNEVEVLTKKRASIDDTLARAVSAYDDITVLATRTQNAEALASIINSKIAIIERLTQERININEQLDRLARSKEDQLDRLKYTHFYVNIYENKYIDPETITESWKNALRQFVYNVNQAVQDVTLGLIALLITIAQYALYALILLLVVKYGWKLGRRIWEM